MTPKKKEMYPINAKTALAEVAEFECTRREFGPRILKTLAHLSASPAELLRETVELTGGLYKSRYTLPK